MEKVQLVFITTKVTYGRLEDFLEAPQFLPLIYLSTTLYSCSPLSEMKWGLLGRDRMVAGFKLPVQSVPITTNVVRSNPTQVRCT